MAQSTSTTVDVHFLMGDAMGRAMAMLLEGKQPRNSEGGGVK